MRYLALLLSGCGLFQSTPDTKHNSECISWCAEVDRMSCFKEWGIEKEDGTCLEACADIVKDEGVCLRSKANSCVELDEYECK